MRPHLAVLPTKPIAPALIAASTRASTRNSVTGLVNPQGVHIAIPIGSESRQFICIAHFNYAEWKLSLQLNGCHQRVDVPAMTGFYFPIDLQHVVII
jgi:hypothetical protein